MFSNLNLRNLFCLAVAGTATLVSLAARGEGCGIGILPMRQIHSFSLKRTRKDTQIRNKIMQNKPNLLNAQMFVSDYITNDYENLRLYRRCKNKPNQTQFWLCNSQKMIINGGYNDFQE